MKKGERLKMILGKIGRGLKSLVSPGRWKERFIWLKTNGPGIIKDMRMFLSFFLLIVLFLLRSVGGMIMKFKPIGFVVGKLPMGLKNKGSSAFKNLIKKVDAQKKGEMKRSYLIRLAYQNMGLKKIRSIVTVGGMAVGIGSIVFLVSIGYGLEKLVISRVARLEELRMFDVSPGENKALRLSDEVREKFLGVDGVDEVVPIVSVVGRVVYNKAQTDVLAHAVPNRYFGLVQTEVFKGDFYENDDISYTPLEGDVAGVSDELLEGMWGEMVDGGGVIFNIGEGERVVVHEEPEVDSKVLGYSQRIEGGVEGVEYWGSTYYSPNFSGWEGKDIETRKDLGRWYKAKFPIYDKTAEDELRRSLGVDGRPKWEWGYVTGWKVQVLERELKLLEGEVLGETDEASSSASVASEASGLAVVATEASGSAAIAEAMSELDTVVVSTDSSGVEWVELSSSVSAQKKEITVLGFEREPDREAVVSTGMLNLLSLIPTEAIGKEFTVSFIIVKSLVPEIEGKALSEEMEYKVVGVIEDDDEAYFYVPLTDLRKVGVSNYSQLKVVLEKKDGLDGARKEVETLGFRTSSTADTVEQIEGIFGNLRLLLSSLGLVALGVAILGMFNTLTVSLLERTREIGGMKAMGMTSGEVKDLFLAEAMVMGLTGGMSGLLLGYLIGKILSIAISGLSLFGGQGFLNLTYIPPFFVVFIVFSSFLVGLFTGLYPAHRATKISALNALRYE